MRIAYVAKHDSGGNDDEGAIHHALSALGHDVQRLREIKGRSAHKIEADLVLFHKWRDPWTLSRLKARKVFWWFDLVDFPDPTLSRRCAERRAWMEEMTPLVDLGFCTDGDWVDRDRTGKLVWLTQGADQRILGASSSLPDGDGLDPPILFTGTRNGGQLRASFVDEMQVDYRSAFNHVHDGIHGRRLADLIARSQIVVAPDSPVSDKYWSNRAYVVTGFGGFLLHPECAGLADHLKPGRDVVYYRDRRHLRQLIQRYYHHPEERGIIAAAGLARTTAEHTYLHRCAELMRVIKERLP